MGHESNPLQWALTRYTNGSLVNLQTVERFLKLDSPFMKSSFWWLGRDKGTTQVLNFHDSIQCD